MEEYSDIVNELFICQCNNVNHQLIFTYDKDSEEVYASIYLVTERNIFKRIWSAIKYIIGFYISFDEFIFKKSDADKLQKIVNHLKEK